jgi:hypothetical protein
MSHHYDETHLDFHDQPDESPYRHCRSCDVLAFEPSPCEKCGLLVCTDCGEKCDTCQQWYCAEKIGNDCLNAHGCKRKADPADVLVLSGAYEGHWTERLEEVYSINGRTYFVLRSTVGVQPLTRVFRYKGAGERDVVRNGILEARPYIDDEEVGTVMPDGSTDWYDEDEVAADDHRIAEDR